MQYGREFEAEEDGGEVLDLKNLENDDFDALFSSNRDLGKQFAALLVAMVTTVLWILSTDSMYLSLVVQTFAREKKVWSL